MLEKKLQAVHVAEELYYWSVCANLFTYYGIQLISLACYHFIMFLSSPLFFELIINS